MEIWGAPPQGPQQDKASTLSNTEEWCGLRLPDYCVSKGWARPLLQPGRQNPEWQLSQMPFGFQAALGSDREEPPSFPSSQHRYQDELHTLKSELLDT